MLLLHGSGRPRVSPVDRDVPNVQIPPLTELLPAEPLLLMTAGPVPVPMAVARAGGLVINHVGESMNMLLRHIKEMSRYTFQTNDDKILGVSGPASAAMEMAVGNLLWPGRKALVLQGGWFGSRFQEMAIGVGAEVDMLSVEKGVPVTADLVKEKLSQGTYDIVTMVQGETSCGVWTVELPEIVRLCNEHGAMCIVDAVCTLSTMPLKKDKLAIDVVLTGSQKGLSSLPGVALIAFSDAAWEVMEKRPEPRPHWCLNVLRAQKFWGDHEYHYTAPVSGLLALHEALRLICEETLEKRFKRHLQCSLALQAGLEAMGMTLAVPPEHRLNSVVAINTPAEVDPVEARTYMSRMFKVEISGAFGLDILRIGQMGEQCRAPNLFRVLHALGVAVAKQGFKVNQGAGMAALESHLADHAEDIL